MRIAQYRCPRIQFVSMSKTFRHLTEHDKEHKLTHDSRAPLHFRYHLEQGYPVRVPRESKEVHSRHEDGVRRVEEAAGAGRSNRIFRTIDKVDVHPGHRRLHRSVSAVESVAISARGHSDVSRHFSTIHHFTTCTSRFLTLPLHPIPILSPLPSSLPRPSRSSVILTRVQVTDGTQNVRVRSNSDKLLLYCW